MIKKVLSAAALLPLAATGAFGEGASGKYKATLVFDRALPNVPGKSIRTVFVE